MKPQKRGSYSNATSSGNIKRQSQTSINQINTNDQRGSIGQQKTHIAAQNTDEVTSFKDNKSQFYENANNFQSGGQSKFLETERQRDSNGNTKRQLHVNNSEIASYRQQIMNTASNQDFLNPSMIDPHNFNFNPKNLSNIKQNMNIRKGSQYTNITVVARFRPLTPQELSNQAIVFPECAEFIDDKSVYLKAYNNEFSCKIDRIFNNYSSQEDLFVYAAKETIDYVLNGYNGTVFAYGQGNSGKTHTMFGEDMNDNDSRGIIPRAIDYIFDFIENNTEVSFIVSFSMIEIYKEKLKDLLKPKTPSEDLKIHDDHSHGSTIITNLHREIVDNRESTFAFLENGNKIRNIHESYINKKSTRSHVVVMIEVIQRLADGTQKRGLLNLIDLACGEKVSKTFASGQNLEEAKCINLSLSSLGNVIQCLTSNKEEYIPYKDSKLTKLLQESLGGVNKTTLIVNCSPHILHYEDTVGSLKFGQRAKKIRNKIRPNAKATGEQLEDIIKNLTKQLKEEKMQNEQLRALLKTSKDEVKREKERTQTKKITQSKFGSSNPNVSFNKKVTFNDNETSRLNINAVAVKIEEDENEEDSIKEQKSHLITQEVEKAEKEALEEELRANEAANKIETFDDVECGNEECSKYKESLYGNIKKQTESIKNLNHEIYKLKLANASKNYIAQNNNDGDMSSNLNTTNMLGGGAGGNLKKQIKDIDEVVKNNLKELNKIKKSYIETKNSNMLNENKQLRDYNKKFEEKFFKDTKKFEMFLKQTDFDTSALLDSNNEPVNRKFTQSFLVLIKGANTASNPPSIEGALKPYEEIFTNTQLILSNILDEYFEKEHPEISKNNLIFDNKSEKSKEDKEGDGDSALNEEIFKVKKLKKALLSYTIINAYYEKIVSDLLNRVLLDLKRFVLQDKYILEYGKRVDDYEKILETYITVINDLKKTKSTQEDTRKETKKSTTVKSNILGDLEADPTSEGTDITTLKNELNMYKSYVDGLRSDNSKLISEKKSLDEIADFYKNQLAQIHKKEFDQVRASIQIMKDFYEDESSKKSDIISKLSEFISELLLKINPVKDEEKAKLENRFNLILTKYYNIKKANILNHQYKDTTKLKLFDWVESLTGTATKKLDYVKINILNNNPHDLRIECGTGLRSQNYFYHNPLVRNFKNTLQGDNNYELESEAEYKGESFLD